MDQTPSVRVEPVYSDHVSRSHLRPRNHVSHEQETWNLRLEIDHLHKQPQRRVHVREDRTPSSSQSFGSKKDRSYKQRTRTPLSKSFTSSSHTKGGERRHRRRNKNSFLGNMGNEAMSRALCQISSSPFTHRIERAKLAHGFTQPTFTIYNGRIDLMEHVSHFN